MYGLADQLKIDGLVDSELQQICVGKFDLQFRFSSGTMIAVQNKARIFQAGLLTSSWTEENGWDSVGYQSLLNVEVVGYQVPENTLHIEFRNGLLLELTDDSDQFESMQIYPFGDVDKVIVI